MDTKAKEFLQQIKIRTGETIWGENEIEHPLTCLLNDYHQSQSIQLKQRIEELEGTIQSALLLKDLWFPINEKEISPEYQGEFIALNAMKLSFETALNNKEK